ncbi:hypothetical protein OROGR_005562 [Orobanche gracilis]
MGVANKAWRYNAGVLVNNLAAEILQNQIPKQQLSPNPQLSPKPQHCSNCLPWRRRTAVPWTVVCGLLLFAVGLISLFAVHVASDLEWYSQRLVKRTWYYKSLIDVLVLQLIYGIQSFQTSIMAAAIEALNLHVAISCFRFLNVLVCSTPVREKFSNGHLLIGTSGGLNQQRTGITDAVVVARILNATLVVPELDHHSYWKDQSDFVNIFDVDWFISYLSKDVPIVKRVPEKVMRSMDKPPYTMRVPRKSEPDYYLEQVLPILLRRRRFEPDMLAFSGCYFGWGDKERHELAEIRKRWDTLPELSPDEERTRGKCPLTPHEVGLLRRALDFDNNTYLYVASGEIYGGEETLRPLKELFPNFYTKETLASEELKSLVPFSSRLAALDYIVCDESDVFVTNNNGNMAKILSGRRKYMGHKRTIRPNAKRLSALFAARDKMEWSTFSRKVKSCQRGFMGEPEEMRPGRGEFHEYPSACICQKPSKYLDVDENRILDRSPNVSADGSSNEYNVSEEVKLEKRSTRNKTVYAVEEMYPGEVLSFD